MSQSINICGYIQSKQSSICVNLFDILDVIKVVD